MNLGTFAKNLPPTTRILLADLRRGVRKALKPKPHLSEQERRVLQDLRRDGFAVVKDYWPRAKALAMRDRLEAYLEAGKNRDFENGAYLRFWDDRPYDMGVRRLYHVERLVPELKDLRTDPLVTHVTTAYYGRPFHSRLLAFQHNTRSNSNTRYYHVDAFEAEFKTFLYLDDVDPGNGPFTYLRGTHRRRWLRLRKQIVGNKNESPTGFTEDDLKRFLADETQVCASAGTFILADVRGIHRGSPQGERTRSILMNYMYPDPGDIFLDK